MPVNATSAVHVVCADCTTINRVLPERLGSGAKCGRCKHALFKGAPLELTDSNFIGVVTRSDVPTVVDFWAAWCGPCRMMAPHFERAAAELEPNVRLAKLETDASPQTAGRYSIRSIPTIAIFRAGEEIARQAGAMEYGALVRWIRANV